jgi:hypothetical protein
MDRPSRQPVMCHQGQELWIEIPFALAADLMCRRAAVINLQKLGRFTQLEQGRLQARP